MLNTTLDNTYNKKVISNDKNENSINIFYHHTVGVFHFKLSIFKIRTPVTALKYKFFNSQLLQQAYFQNCPIC